MTASVITLAQPATFPRPVRSTAAEVVTLEPPRLGDRAAARDEIKRRARIWDLAWTEYQAHSKLQVLVDDLCRLKRRGRHDSELLKTCGFLLRQSGGAAYHDQKESLLRLLLTPAPNNTALAWKIARLKKAYLTKSEATCVHHMIAADREFVSGAKRGYHVETH